MEILVFSNSTREVCGGGEGGVSISQEGRGWGGLGEGRKYQPSGGGGGVGQGERGNRILFLPPAESGLGFMGSVGPFSTTAY